jgi:hypothetical protein
VSRSQDPTIRSRSSISSMAWPWPLHTPMNGNEDGNGRPKWRSHQHSTHPLASQLQRNMHKAHTYYSARTHAHTRLQYCAYPPPSAQLRKR